METYKQEVKNQSRELIWQHAISSLTTKRSDTRVLRDEYIRKSWGSIFYKNKYTKQYFENKSEPNIQYINSWSEFADNTYYVKKASELKIAYLCGPEPENDLNILLMLGVRIENVWAIESDKKTFEIALSNIRTKYPTLKIFNGTIKDFFEIYRIQFDIIYLDFTAPIFSQEGKPFLTIHNIFDNQVLAELGILITNYSIPDKTDDMVELLTDFFMDQRYIEGSVYGEKGDDGKIKTNFLDGVSLVYGADFDTFKGIVDKNFESSYSAFCSLYPIFYSNVIAPEYRVVKENVLRRKLFNNSEEVINTYNEKMIYSYDGCYTNYPEIGFIQRLKNSKSKLCKYWNTIYTSKEAGSKYSRAEAAKLSGQIKCAEYDLLSENLVKSIKKTYKFLNEYEDNRLFCDLLMPQSLIEVALNQFGMPYHPNFFNHKRYKYKAKTREMFLDAFTFDRCRAFYDWIPLMELYGENIQLTERQMIFRICLDAIGGKQLGFTPIPVYESGVNIFGIGEEEFAQFVWQFPERKLL